MALNDLSTDTMLGISDNWTAEGEARKRLHAYKPFAGLFELIEQVHEDLLAATKVLAAPSVIGRGPSLL